MPHIILEYTQNIEEKPDFDALFADCHTILATTLPTDMRGCKSRAYPVAQFYIYDGAKEHAFVHVTIKVMPGRSKELLDTVVEKIMAVTKQAFRGSSKSLQFSVEMMELQNYLKL